MVLCFFGEVRLPVNMSMSKYNYLRKPKETLSTTQSKCGRNCQKVQTWSLQSPTSFFDTF